MVTIEDAIELCRLVESVAPMYGCHVALTGGTLYKEGERKDIDILFYRIRQVDSVDTEGLLEALNVLGVVKVGGFGWVHKALWKGISIDMFFPEEQEGDQVYPPKEEDNAVLNPYIADLIGGRI